MIINHPMVHTGTALSVVFACAVVAGFAGGVLAFALLWSAVTVRAASSAR